jgi:hypothetical protein
VPRRRRVGGLTWYQLRRWFEERGKSIGTPQVKAFVEAGLLEAAPRDAETQLWPYQAAELMLEIIQAEEQAHSLDRRVIWLRRNYPRFPVPGSNLRTAMARLAPQIAQPSRKMLRVHQAAAQVARGLPAAAARPRWPPPAPADWVALLEDPSLEPSAFEASGAVAGQYLLANVLDQWAASSGVALGLPYEELVTLLMVRHLAARQMGLEHGVFVPAIGEGPPGADGGRLAEVVQNWASAEAEVERVHDRFAHHVAEVHLRYHDRALANWQICPDSLCRTAVEVLTPATTEIADQLYVNASTIGRDLAEVFAHA